MGQRQSGSSRNSRTTATASTPYKLFEYQCPTCNSKRPLQYFYKNDIFLQQAPRVVCGDCNTSVTVEPFKTVEYSCPWCKKMHRVRLPAKPIALNKYNVSVASCNCGFKGEVQVGRLMDVCCSVCWNHKRELRGVWTEDGDEIKAYCEICQGYERAFARDIKKQKAEQAPDMEFHCENCCKIRPIGAEELLRSGGLTTCSHCGWVGYPEVLPKGQLAAKASLLQSPVKTEKPKKPKDEKAKRPEKNNNMVTPIVPEPQILVEEF